MAIVHLAYEHLNRRDVEGLIGLCRDDFLLDMSERVFNPDIFKGHDGIRSFVAGVTDAWESYLWDVEETLVADDAVVAMVHCEGLGWESGVQVDWRVAWLWRFHQRELASARFYRDPARALEAVGLESRA